MIGTTEMGIVPSAQEKINRLKTLWQLFPSRAYAVVFSPENERRFVEALDQQPTTEFLTKEFDFGALVEKYKDSGSHLFSAFFDDEKENKADDLEKTVYLFRVVTPLDREQMELLTYACENLVRGELAEKLVKLKFYPLVLFSSTNYQRYYQRMGVPGTARLSVV